MAWLWNDEHEYHEWTAPVIRDRPAAVRFTRRETWFSAETNLREAVATMQHGVSGLRQLGFHAADTPTRDDELLDATHRCVLDVVWGGETLLLYHKRLAQTDWAYDFCHAHEIVREWQRHAATD